MYKFAVKTIYMKRLWHNVINNLRAIALEAQLTNGCYPQTEPAANTEPRKVCTISGKEITEDTPYVTDRQGRYYLISEIS